MIWWLLTLILLWPIPTLAHPGRTDADGCHIVQKAWVSKDKKRTYPKGTRHCHRVSDNVFLGPDHIIVEEDLTPPPRKVPRTK